MSDIISLADDYYAFRQQTDINRLMWDGSLEQLSQWEQVAPESILDRQRRLREFADAAEQATIDPSSEREVALRDAVIFTARADALQLTWGPELHHVNPRMGLLPLAMVFISRFPLRTEAHGDEYLDKLRHLPPLLDDLVAAAQAAALEGRVALSRHLIEAAEACEAYVTGASEHDDAFLAQAPPSEHPNPEVWTQERDAIVAEQVRPAIERYGQALRTLAERGRDDAHPGLVHLEGGAELYRELVWSHTSVDLAPEEIHQLGLDIIASLEDEYRELAGPLLGTQDIDQIYARLRDDESMEYQDAEAIVRDATTALDRAAIAASAWFARVPASPCVARAATSGPLAFYSPPQRESGKAGEFFFNAADPSAWSTFELEAITFHESIPGHHLQFATHEEDDLLHPVLKHLGVTAYLEGWGLYTERLADEMGLYSSDLDRVGMLAADSLRACRLVADTGIHALGWSRDQAIDYMVAHTPLSRQQVASEVDRYIGLPGQALAYMIGRREITAIRAEAERREGFDIREFHDAVLRPGMVPLPTLRTLVLGAD